MSQRSVVTERDAFVATARDAPTGARIPIELTLTVDDPFDAYRRARRDADRGGCFLETTGGQPGWGYFGVDPIERMQVGPEAVSLVGKSPTLEALTARLSTETLVRGDCSVPYPCGAIGWVSYDVARELESLPETTVDDRNLPRLQLAIYDRLVAWSEPRPTDRPTTIHITACPVVDSDPVTVYNRGLKSAESLVERIETGSDEVGHPPAERTAVEFVSECGRIAFEDRVRRVKSYIRDGDTFQANISQRLVAPAAVHPLDTFDALRRVNPAPYSALLEFPGVDLVSASPELLLRVDGKRLHTEPIAGTRPRAEATADDETLERELRSDEKERAEHAMLVDLERNDLGKVSEYGSVRVTDYRRVDRYASVMHLVSLVEGRRRDTASMGDVIAAVFPGGTITGAPKPRTMEIIDEVETRQRGPYTGSIGIFGFDDRATLNIIIRTLVRYRDEYHLRVGAGIVHDSVPSREYEETLDKARGLIDAVDTALGDRASMEIHAGDR